MWMELAGAGIAVVLVIVGVIVAVIVRGTVNWNEQDRLDDDAYDTHGNVRGRGRTSTREKMSRKSRRYNLRHGEHG